MALHVTSVVRGILLAGFVTIMTGCATAPGRTDLVAGGLVKAEAKSSKAIEISTPAVYTENGVLVVSGTVTRKPGVEAPIDGYLNISFIDPANGDYLGQLWVAWDPKPIPTEGDRRAEYVAWYSWSPPAGTIVRVEHSTEPIIGQEISGAAGGGPGGGPGTLGKPTTVGRGLAPRVGASNQRPPGSQSYGAFRPNNSVRSGFGGRQSISGGNSVR